MSLSRIIRTLPLAGALAAFATVAQAVPMTLATIGVDGTIDFSQTGSTTSLGLSGSFEGEGAALLATDFDMPMDYILGASLSFNGVELFNDSIEADDTSLNDIIAVGLNILQQIDSALGGLPASFIADLLDDGSASIFPFLSAEVTNFTLDATSFSGDFDIAAFLPFGNEACGSAVYLRTVSTGPSHGGGSLCSLSGTFALDLSISKDVAAVPLPAGAPLLLLGLGGLAAARRRRT